MKSLTYGMTLPEEVVVQVHPQFEAFELGLGWEKMKNPVAKFKLYGIDVTVYDKVVAGQIHELTGIGRAYADLEQYLERVLFLALQQNPTYLEYALNEAFARGRREARSERWAA